ncbi:CAP22 protein [Ophiocordyceps camponoti-floridani]|uniref:CAP22 protein n=1 Tax=Ophiocordyceps camponoti-floridani TaxID=2030778 RepID=A0A8H4VFU2_9HYPO|nr:CAP22 protein [Ophiocordyceps camponoti-floridani]
MELRDRKLAFALAATALIGVEARIELDMDDVPDVCSAMCRPIGNLTSACDTKLPDATDADEKLLEAQCVCTNKSFNVSRVAGLCAGCLTQDLAKATGKEKTKLRAPVRDINEILSACNFAGESYASTATSVAETVTVEATAATDIGQLTTTLSRATLLPTEGAARSGGGWLGEGVDECVVCLY